MLNEIIRFIVLSLISLFHFSWAQNKLSTLNFWARYHFRSTNHIRILSIRRVSQHTALPCVASIIFGTSYEMVLTTSVLIRFTLILDHNQFFKIGLYLTLTDNVKMQKRELVDAPKKHAEQMKAPSSQLLRNLSTNLQETNQHPSASMHKMNVPPFLRFTHMGNEKTTTSSCSAQALGTWGSDVEQKLEDVSDS